MWKEEDLKKAMELSKSGKTFNEIGEILNKTGHAVKCKFLKNGLRLKDFRSLKKDKKVKCLNCGKDIQGKNRKFCNNSCSAIYNNKLRGHLIQKEIIVKKIKDEDNKFCLNCGKKLNGKNIKFCNNKCNGKYLESCSIDKWKRGESSGSETNGKTTQYLRKYLFEKYNNKCAKCGWGERNEFTKKIPLEVEHINGNSSNNNEDNLTLLCPNCHSLTKTYKGANRGNGRHYRRERYKNGQSF